MADFEHRLENRTQAYGMEQLLRFVGPPAVVGLPKLMTRDAKRLDQMAAPRRRARRRQDQGGSVAALVAIAQCDPLGRVDQGEDARARGGQQAASKLEPTPKQFQMQLAQYQDEELIRALRLDAQGRRRARHRLLPRFRREEGPEREAPPGRARRARGAPRPQQPDDIKRILAIAASRRARRRARPGVPAHRRDAARAGGREALRPVQDRQVEGAPRRRRDRPQDVDGEEHRRVHGASCPRATRRRASRCPRRSLTARCSAI